MSNQPVRVRFAPSPTGYLHIGGARTAIYNWLLARATGGQFLLRIEDTDRTRYVEDALQDIMASLRWLGLDWDEGPETGGPVGPYFQSKRLDLYQKYAEQLVAEGKAYYCFCSAERLAAVRVAQEASKQPPGYDRRCRNLTSDEVAAKKAEGQIPVIRFKVPLEGTTTVVDELRGEMLFENRTLDDLVLLKSDGFPTYHLANIIDDHFMGITHVMRGDEWIASTPRHILLYGAFGWQPPKFAHLPVFLAPSGGGKLSKRHGATSVREYREKGYLPEALFNFLLLLGWHPQDEQEMFTREEAVKAFSLERISKSPVAFATDKLDWFNGLYIRKMDVHELSERCLPILQRDGLIADPCPPDRFEYLVKIVPLVQERLKLLPEISELVDFFLNDDIPAPPPDLLIQKNTTTEQTVEMLRRSMTVLEQAPSLDHEHADPGLRALAEEFGVKAGQVFMPIRVAISGRTATPGLFETMDAVGKERVLRRMRNAIEVLK